MDPKARLTTTDTLVSPAADGTRRVRRMHGVPEQHGLIGTKRIQKSLVGFDEPLLLLRIELAPDRFRLAVFEPKPMQQVMSPERLS